MKKRFLLILCILFIFANSSEGGNVTYLNDTTYLAYTFYTSNKTAIAYDPINQRYLFAWRWCGYTYHLGYCNIFASFVDKDGYLIGGPKVIMEGEVGMPYLVYDPIHAVYCLMNKNGEYPHDRPVNGVIMDLDGNVKNHIGDDNWRVYASDDKNNLVFNSLTGRFLFKVWSWTGASTYFVFDIDGTLHAAKQFWLEGGSSGDFWQNYVSSNANEVFGSYYSLYLVTPAGQDFFMNDDLNIISNVKLSLNERVVGYDESLSQYILLGADYLINLNSDGSYAGEKRIIQGLVSSDGVKLKVHPLAFDYQRKRFLAYLNCELCTHPSEFYKTYIALINFDGSLYSDISEFPSPSGVKDIQAAFDTVNNRYLLTWSDSLSTASRLVSGDTYIGIPYVPPIITEPIPELAVAKSGTGTGAVVSSPAGINCGADCSEAYAVGTVVTITATPDSGSVFIGWSGACSGIGTCTITMDANKSVTAVFDQTLPSTPSQSQGQGSGTNNQGTSNATGLQNAPGVQTAPGLQKK